MDIQKIFDNEIEAKRAEEMKTSKQLMLSELIMKLEAVEYKGVPVVFDDGVWWPVDLDSWRGSYRELALSYANDEDKWSVACVLSILKAAVGETFEGYKGGDFLMGKNTPIWVADYGNSQGFGRNNNGDCQAVVDVEVREGEVAIITELMDSIVLRQDDGTDFPEVLCAACTGQGVTKKADLFLALGMGGKGEHTALESCIYVPFCYDHVDLARARIPEGHMARDMPDLLI